MSTKLFDYSERHLQCVWADSTYRPQTLTTTEGEEVTIESPGRWNLEAGPDFLDAVIKLGDKKITGDVEIHIHPTDWIRHNHANDQRYNKVAIHVSYFFASIPTPYIPENVIQVSLIHALKSNPGFSFDDIDITAYPHSAHHRTSPPCSTALMGRDPDWTIKVLETSGRQRMKLKADRMRASFSKAGRMQTLYRELMIAMGYKNNKKNFRKLAGFVPVSELLLTKNNIEAYALLMGISGFLPTKISPNWDAETCIFVRKLWDIWWKRRFAWEDMTMEKEEWHTAGMRPHNHPIRRMAAMANIARNLPAIEKELARYSSSTTEKWCKRARTLIKKTAIMKYWRKRLSLDGCVRQSDIALLGDRRIAAILSNVIMPYMIATDVDVADIIDTLPAEENNSIIRLMAFTLLTRDHNPALLETGLRQQGLIQIFQDFCLANKDGCKRCALVEKLNGYVVTKEEPCYASMAI